MEVGVGYPQPIGRDWLVCAEMQSDSPATEANGTDTRRRGLQHADHAESGYEVCSCTSDSAAPPSSLLALAPLWRLAPLWTLLLTLSAPL